MHLFPLVVVCCAVLAADTLLPEGHGQPLTPSEISLVWDVAQALGKALDAAGVALQKDAARGGAVEALAELQAAVQAARRDAPALAAAVEGETSRCCSRTVNWYFKGFTQGACRRLLWGVARYIVQQLFRASGCSWRWCCPGSYQLSTLRYRFTAGVPTMHAAAIAVGMQIIPVGTTHHCGTVSAVHQLH